jgi:hypothetical protein
MTLLLMAMVIAGTPKLEVEKTGHVFTSREGLEVALAAVRPPGPKRALVRITRPGASPASQVWLARVNESLEISQYTVTLGGHPHLLLVTRMGNPVVYPPGEPREVAITWHDEKSRALDTRQLLDEYLRQEAPKK